MNIKIMAALIASTMLLTACGEKNEGNKSLTVTNTRHTECLSHNDKGAESPDTLSVVYDNGTLHVTHHNLYVNCGSALAGSVINVSVSVDGTTINIRETEDESNPQQRCMCEVDNQFDITGITPGTYTLTLHNWYPEPQSFVDTF